MKTSLVYPPGSNRNCEAFSLPNIAIAALAFHLRKKKIPVSQHDLDILYFKKIKKTLGPARNSLLLNEKIIIAYCLDKTGKKETALLDETADLFLKEGKIKKPDLLGVTLVDLTKDPLMTNVSALICKRVKKLWKCKTVIGYGSIPLEVYSELMKKYRVFDYAIFSERGEEPLEALIHYLEKGGGSLMDVMEFSNGKIKTLRTPNDHCNLCPSPYFQKDTLNLYRVRGNDLVRSYNCVSELISGLFTERDSELTVPYSFIRSCSGVCAFCGNDASSPSNSKSVGQILDELGELKEKGVTGIYFINSNFNDNYSFAEKLCEEMVKSRFSFQWVDCANFRNVDENLLKKMRASGAVKLTFGMETGSDKLLKYIRKGINREKIEKMLKISHQLGIFNQIELIGGLPHETPQDIAETEAFIRESRDLVDIYSLNPFYLYPDSPFGKIPKQFGLRILSGEKDLDYSKTEKDQRMGGFSSRFEEIGGLSWPEKDKQIVASTDRISKTIKEVSSYNAIDFEHVYLLFFLYRKFGHAKKDMIRKIFKLMSSKFRPYNLEFFMSEIKYAKHKFNRTLS